MSNDTELTELCPHCFEEVAYREDTAILDEIINGGSPTFSLPVCPVCMQEILPCAYCHTDETVCSNCPFEKYRKDVMHNLKEYKEMMREFDNCPIEDVPFKSRALLKSGDSILFQGKNAEGERLNFFWVQKRGKLVRWSHRLSACLPYVNF